MAASSYPIRCLRARVCVIDNRTLQKTSKLLQPKGKRKQLEALRKLLQFQVNKIHAMQRICRNICFALVGLHLEVQKLNTLARTDQRRVVRHENKETLSESTVKNVANNALRPNQHGVSRRLEENKVRLQSFT